MFIIKKIVSPLFQPLSFGLEIIACGLILLWFTRHVKWGRAITTAGAFIILILSLSPVSDLALRPLEDRAVPYLNEAPEQQPALTGDATREPRLNSSLPGSSAQLAGSVTSGRIAWIVVLGGGSTDDPHIPPNSRLSLESIARLTEGVRLYQRLPGSRLILSGGGAFGERPEAEVLAETAQVLGVPSQDLILEKNSRDTEEQALFIRPLVGGSPFLLVTSAYHMPRSIALFRKLAMAPIPAPTAFMARQSHHINPAAYFPTAGGLQNSERAFHEYLGLCWSWLKGSL